MINLRERLKKFNIAGELRPDEPMRLHTSFRVGGPADLYAVPADPEDLAALLRFAREEGLPVFPLGEGANILVADAGIEGLVIDLSAFRGLRREGDVLAAGAGLPMSELADRSAAMGLAGAETFYAMPGSVGGSVFMNARCYGISVSDALAWAEYLDEDLARVRTEALPGEWDYKKSPFQGRRVVIIEAAFRLRPGDPAALRAAMDGFRRDRESKGHFSAPSAGSVFKNDRRFGSPTGRLLDGLDLRGFRIGGAKVSELHANIVVNSADATASDLLRLIRHMEKEARDRLGIELEREVICVGRWEGAE